jgi:hypothetical protein
MQGTLDRLKPRGLDNRFDFSHWQLSFSNLPVVPFFPVMTVLIIGTGRAQAQIKLFYEHENLVAGLVPTLGSGVIREKWVLRVAVIPK